MKHHTVPSFRRICRIHPLLWMASGSAQISTEGRVVLARFSNCASNSMALAGRPQRYAMVFTVLNRASGSGCTWTKWTNSSEYRSVIVCWKELKATYSCHTYLWTNHLFWLLGYSFWRGGPWGSRLFERPNMLRGTSLFQVIWVIPSYHCELAINLSSVQNNCGFIVPNKHQ